MDTKKLRQKILDLAIHGKLVPQYPNDEPASVLLERIRAEKAMLIKEGKIKAPKKSKSAGDTSHYPKDVPFEVPEGWEWCCLEDFVYAVTDGDHLPPPQSNSGIPFLVISDVNTGVINFDKARFVPDSYYDSLPTIRKASIHDILFTVTGSYGIVIPVETKERFCFQRHIGLIKTIESHEWLVFVLQSRYVQAYCDKVATGTAQKTVSLGALRDLPIPIPPRKEQERIGERLQEWLKISNHLGVAGAELNRNIVLAKTKILDFAIHGKLVPQDPSEEPAIEFLKRINPAFQPSHNLHYLDCPSGWAVTQMKSIIELLSGRDLDNSRCNSEGYGVPYLVGASCIDKGRINTYRWTETPEVISKEGDVLLSCKGTVGEVVLNTMGNLHIARQFMAIRSKAPQYILPDYLGIIIKASIETLKKAARGIIPGISREDILGLTVMIPPSEEQQRILSRIAEFNQSVSLIVANTCN